MKIYTEKEILKKLSERGGLADENISRSVSDIISRIRSEGDLALFEFCEKFDKTKVTHLELTKEEIDELVSKVDPKLLATMKKAAANIEEYHKKQISKGYTLKRGGRTLGRIVKPLKRVGVYVPGGTAAYPS
ncbi:MAG: histidinol dehydrogenase, partial [Clostridia bacterium]|nr:histidinol dehydrogenase [Clostridia bacterium]